MKKIIACLLVWMLVLSLVACTNSDDNTETENPTESASETQEKNESESEPPESESGSDSESDSGSQEETETVRPVSGTTDPNDPMFSRYAIDGNYYMYTEVYEKNGYTVEFDINARKMTLTDPEGKAKLYSYDKNYYLSRIDTYTSQVITFENTLSEEGYLTQQLIHSRSSLSESDYSIQYTYDEDGWITGITVSNLTKNDSFSAEFIYCGNNSYLIRSTDSASKIYFHCNYFFAEYQQYEYKTSVNGKGDLEISYLLDPFGEQHAVYTKTSGEQCKMFREFCLNNAMLVQLSHYLK